MLGRSAKHGREASPAEEWLLDNASIVHEQLREIAEDLPFGYLVELPRIQRGAMRGYPRVYGLCVDYLRHTDGWVDIDTLVPFVHSYQAVRPLTIGELWAVPIMLRLGLISIVGAMASSEASAEDALEADLWAERLLRVQSDPSRTRTCLVDLEKKTKRLSAAFLVKLSRRLREADTSLELTREWLISRCAAMGSTPDDLTRREHLRQAADQVSVGNAITSMRVVSAMDWDEFFEHTSDVEAVLSRDPSGAYGDSDKATRDRCRHAVEDIARQSRVSEVTVAQTVLGLAVAAAERSERVQAHVGYHLVDDGRPALERVLRYRPTIRTRVVRAIRNNPKSFYFGLLAALTGVWTLAFAEAVRDSVATPVMVAFSLLLLLPASEVALAFVNALVVMVLPPRRLAKLDFSSGIPDEHRALVVVPVLVDSVSAIDELIEEVEVRSLANPDANLKFGILSDFPDASSEVVEGDEELLQHLLKRLDEVNERFGANYQRYWLLHRRRLYNASERRYMGWERKRGKLHELNRLLRGATDTSFSVLSVERELLSTVRYVITLDADTDLPRDVAAKLVGCMAHPLNAPELDVRKQRVVRGHAVLQPRVGTLPKSSRRTRYSALLTGPSGIDPYTTAVSDTYQDLFGEGSYVGKGIHHVDAFHGALTGRIPENLVLSHDLFEGIYARSALVTDIEVLDEQPTTYAIQASRQHRWIRGDWQLLRWLLPQVPAADGTRANDLGALAYWKLFDNLRRSLLAPAVVLALVGSWFVNSELALAVACLVGSVYVVPIIVRLLLSLYRESASSTRPGVSSLGGDLKSNGWQTLIVLSFTLDQAWLALDAASRAVYRVFVSQRRLLEWTTMHQVSRGNGSADVPARMWWCGLGCGLLLVGIAAAMPERLVFAAPLLVCWGGAPFLAGWLSRPRTSRAHTLSAVDQRLLSLVARKTWRFFDEFVTAGDNHLPPDNFQEDPRGVVAHRTSPTNIGLYLLSVVSARDLGFITLSQTRERLAATMTTLGLLPKYEGHILNWYDTETLQTLEPQYVSTVDSGNLAGYLWTLNEACHDLLDQPLCSTRTLLAVRDALRLASSTFTGSKAEPAANRQGGRSSGEPHHVNRTLIKRELRALDQILVAAEEGQSCSPQLLEEVAGGLERLSATLSASNSELGYWLDQAGGLARRSCDEQYALAPWLAREQEPLLRRLEAIPGVRDTVQELRVGLAQTRSVRQIVATAPILLERIDVISAHAVSFDQGVTSLELLELRQSIQSGIAVAQVLVSDFEQLGVNAISLADGMNFRFLFDERRELFAIGYNVSSARLDSSHYDLLASEARLASMFAIAKGDLPQSHWFRLGRPRARGKSGVMLMSWSGSMFEYLMPLLCTRSNPGTLLAEGCEVAIERQREYASERGVPWGISESAYNVMDLRMTYQYRAFGVPGLGLKAGLGDDLVVAPYATLLSGLVLPEVVGKNIRALQREGLDGPYGLYEAIDYTKEHVPPGRRGVVVKAYMAHHQGMSLVATQNMLLDGLMQQRFHRIPRIKATELLLEERVPTVTPPARSKVAVIAIRGGAIKQEDSVESLGLNASGPLRMQLLGHGELSALVGTTGVGVTRFKGMDVNRFRGDEALEAGGTYVYVRDRRRDHLWSAGFMPTRRSPTFYNVTFGIDRVEFQRKDGDIQTVMVVSLSPEHPVEVRRITLSNHGKKSVELELTTYTEVVLAHRGADVAHRAFGNLFVETEALPEHFALLARRRPRIQGESEVWMVQMLVAENGNFGALDFECSRSRFLGRGGSTAEPAALTGTGPLTQQTGTVLDPVLALRRSVRLAPGATARVTLTTGLANSREEAVALIETYSAKHAITRALELGWAGSRVELRHLGVTSTEVQRFQRLLSATLFPHPALRSNHFAGTAPTRGLAALWAQGVSGDLPIVVCRVDQGESAELCRELLLAHEYWRLNGFASDLVFITDEPAGYLQPALDTVRALGRHAALDQAGGVFLRRADQMSEEERDVMFRAARVVLRVKEGSLARQLRRLHEARVAMPRNPTSSVRAALQVQPSEGPKPAQSAGRPGLEFDNGLGGFSADGTEYVMLLGRGRRTPAPWCNVMATSRFGSLVSESGASYTWHNNSQRHRLTPWSNDAVCDPSGELIYVRDDETGRLWSATPAPLGGDANFVVRHGQGYSRFEHERDALRQALTAFVGIEDDVKFWRLELENQGATSRRLSVFGVVEWVLGQSRELTHPFVSTSYDVAQQVLTAINPLGAFTTARAFLACTLEVSSFTGDRLELFGRSGSASAPAGLQATTLSGRVGVGMDPAGALHVEVEIPAGQSLTLTFLLGEAASMEGALAVCAKYREPGAVDGAFAGARNHWRELLGRVRIRTPDRALNVALNHWLLYQSLSSRIWGRTGFYQSSGAYGFRDQLQDVMALVHTDPSIAREHLLRCAARQFVEGDVQHWWHEETGQGLRTRCSDDMLWLPYVAAEYVKTTGDWGVLDELVPFLVERELSPHEEDLFSAPAHSTERATLYEHCVRALNAGTTSGAHGLPTMRGGDWNDGMNRVGHEGTGESVWLGWFLARTQLDFAEIARMRGEHARAMRCEHTARELGAALDAHAWDGQWYRRAFFDDGTPLGSRQNSECRIDAIAQSWAVLAGIGDPERAALALASSEAHLISRDLRLMKLLTPAFEHTQPDPGYIQAYPAGIRENGGQYTHGVLWSVMALAKLGEGDRAHSLLDLLNPVRRGESAEGVKRYVVEPYVVAADVYAGSGHEGRGGWTWYTGSAGWMYRIALESVLGVSKRGSTLIIAPSIPRAWPGFEVDYRFGSTQYRIAVTNPQGVCHGVASLELDGRALPGNELPLRDDGCDHQVKVILGQPRSQEGALARRQLNP